MREALRLRPYIDTDGKTTIGWGRNLTDDGIRLSEAELLVNNDLNAAVVAVAHALPWTNALDDVRLGVLLELEFNIGLAGELGFVQMLDLLRRDDYAAAGAALLDSKWAGQVHATRARQMATQLITGIR
jgi:lysozyme